MHKYLKENNNPKFQTTLLKSGDIKINAEEENDYRSITKALNQSKIEWYSFENKQTRPIKVMARNIHASWSENEVLEDLKNKNFAIIQVAQLRSRKDKRPLPLFMLTFEKQEDIKKIYEIKEILHMKVTIEALRRSNVIPQCKNCQGYGHTQKYCRREARCVKCIGKHHTKDCQKPKQSHPKCVNCGEAHPANYRGCVVATELQKMRNNSNQKKTETKTSENITRQLQQVQYSQTQVGKTYGQIAGNTNVNVQELQEEMTVNQMLTKIIEKLDQQDSINKAILERVKILELGSTRGANQNKLI